MRAMSTMTRLPCPRSMGGSVTPFLESLESVIAAGLRRGSPPGRAQSGLPAMQRGRPTVRATY